jgi:DNA-binding MarR family transcriptional regulator
MYTPRNDQPMEMEIGMVEGEALYWNWEVYKETSLSQETIDQFCQIIVALRDRFDVWKKEGEEQNHPIYGFTATELAKGLGLERSQIVKNLNRLLQTDAISMYTSNRRHIYHLFNDGSTWLDSVILDYDNQQEIKQRQDDLDRGVISDLLSCKNVDEINEVVAQLSEEERTRINSKLTKEEVVIISLIRFPYKYKIGDIVALDTKDDTNKYRVIERNFDSKKPKEAELDYCHLYTLVALDVTDDNEQPIILQNQRSTNLISVEEKFGGENDTKEISQETEEVSNEVEEKDDSDEVQSQIEPDTIVPESDDDVPFDLDDEYDLSDLEM